MPIYTFIHRCITRFVNRYIYTYTYMCVCTKYICVHEIEQQPGGLMVDHAWGTLDRERDVPFFSFSPRTKFCLFFFLHLFLFFFSSPCVFPLLYLFARPRLLQTLSARLYPRSSAASKKPITVSRIYIFMYRNTRTQNSFWILFFILFIIFIDLIITCGWKRDTAVDI